MCRSLRIILIIILLFTAVAVRAQDMEIPEDLIKQSQKYIAARTPEEKAALCEEAMLKYYNIPMAMQELIYLYVDHKADELNKPDEALEFLNGKFRKLELPLETVARLDNAIVRIHGRPGHAERLAEHVARFAKERRLSTADRINIIEAAAEAGAWDLLDRHTRILEALAEPAAVKSEYSDRNMSDERAKQIADRRKALVLTAQGWSLTYSGNSSEALEKYDEAASLVEKDYFGIPRDDINLFRGRTLALMGRYNDAADVLAPMYLYRKNLKAEKELKKIHEVHGVGSFQTWLVALGKKTAPVFDGFTLKNYSDSEQKFEQIRGKATVVSFWSTTCQKCMVELPNLEPIYQKYSPKGLRIIAIEGNRDAKNAKAFIERHNLSYTFLEDGSGENNMGMRYLIDALPTTFLVDSDNRIRYVHIGYSVGDEKELEQEIKSLLGS